ncbi:MAG: diaminopimelate epimerase [Candidatus Omnitrophica bacterium]|nr:diaminopimelate epimerase [Candidatus Omnitrophota bacterium]
MKKIAFTKMQGAGNDFVVVDHVPGMDYCDFTKKVCNRHMGIGADGVLVLGESRNCDFKMSIINADGSEAEMCGNGARCMAVYIKQKFAVVPEIFTLETLAGTIKASVQGEVASVQLSEPKDFRSNVEIKIGDRKLCGYFINTGVPHTVIFVEGLQEFDVNGLGRIIRQHQVFAPKGTNVNFVERVKDGIVAVRTYERGVEAETLACGTGSVAAALIGYLQSQKVLAPVKNAMIKVVTKSGEMLEISFDLDVVNDKPAITNVWLKGSGKFICKGDYYGV